MSTPLTPLYIFDSSRRECASNASAGAGGIVKEACDTFGFRVAGIFQETLASEAQDISTASIPLIWNRFHDIPLSTHNQL